MSDNSVKITKAGWRTDGYGKSEQALYIGRLFVGGITKIYDPIESRKTTPWRGWFMSDDEGDETGWFATADEARKSVEDALNKALS